MTRLTLTSLAAVTVLAVCAPSGARSAPGSSLKPGEKVELRGTEWLVESAGADRVTLVQPPPTQSLGAFITPVSATASDSQAGAGRLPSRLIDGSGWVETYPGSGRYVHGSNVYEAGGCMWNGAAEDAWLLFDLGEVFRLNGFYVWNYNEAGEWRTRGVRSVEVLTSVDGATFASAGAFELALASGLPDDPGQAVAFAEPVSARYLRWVIRSHYRAGEQVGLAEVRFADADRAAPPSRPPDFTPRYPRPEHPRLALGQTLEGAEDTVFPNDAGVVNVTLPPYNAKGDGVSDDTAAIQAALSDHPNMGAIVYLPNGVYRISNTLRWPHGRGEGDEEKRTVLWGQSRDGAVLQLRDDCPGFEDRRRPRAVIWTGQAPAQRFGNEIHNLTVDTGVGNPGACGVQFIANNQGGMYDVAIVSGDGHGVTGLDMGYTDEQGPCLIQRVRVVGFETGVHLATGVASEVLEEVSHERQAVVGLRNDGQPCTIRALRSRNAAPAVRVTAGFTVLVDSELSGVGEAATAAAIVSDAALVLRDVRTSGYRLALESRLPGAETDLPGPEIAEYRSKPGLDLFGGHPEALRLPARATPRAPWDPMDQWASVTRFGAGPGDDGDDADAIQAAIDSGATTVYLPRGEYRIGHTVVLRGALRRLIGCRAWLAPAEPLSRSDAPLLRLDDGPESTVFVEGLATDFSSGPFVFLEHAASRALVLGQLMINFQGARAYRNTGSGDLYIEDVVGRGFTFRGQSVWARQLNPEGDGTHLWNDGGRLWTLGLKTEGGGTLVQTTGGGATEVIGGLSYTVGPGKMAPMFVTEDSDLSASFCEVCFTGDPFAVVARERRGDRVEEIANTDPRWGGHFTLYRARRGNE